MRVSKLKMNNVVIPILDEFFTVGECEGETVFYQKKLRKIHKNAVDLNKKRRAAGRKGGLNSLKGNEPVQAELKPSSSSAAVLLKHTNTKIKTSKNYNQCLEMNGKGHSNGKDHSDAQSVMMIGTRVLELAGIEGEWSGNFNSVRSWLAAGYLAEEHIYPAVKSVASQKTYSPSAISSLAYFSKAVERKYQAVTAENDPTKGWTDQDVKNYLEYYRATGRVFWPQWAGPKPNQPGFRWPDQLIDADLE
jgi:hypothetical protein